MAISYHFHKWLSLKALDLHIVLLIMRAAFEWRIIDFNNKDIESRVHSSIVNANDTLYLFGGKNVK
jgi:predicted ferric reductase